MVQGDLADVVSPGEEEGRVSLSSLTTRSVVRVAQVPVLTLALECALLVVADL